MSGATERPVVPSGLAQEKYRAIVDAGMAEFAEHGYAAGSMRRASLRAGVSKALLFHHFESKRAMFVHLYGFGMAVLHEQLAAAQPHDGDDLFGAVHRMTVAKCRLGTEHPTLAGFMLRAYYEDDPDVRPELGGVTAAPLHQQRERLLALAERTPLRAPATPDQAVDLVVWMAEGVGRRVADGELPEDADLEAHVTAYLEVLRQGLGGAEDNG